MPAAEKIAALVVEEITFGKKTLKFAPPLILVPQQTSGFLSIEDYEYGLDVYGKSRKELLDELHAQLIFLWEEFALAADSSLAPAAALLKKKLLSRITELEHATQ